MTHDAASHEAVEHAHPPYMKIFYLLLGLTVVELGCIFIKQPAIAATILIAIAVWKIALIGRYFMHLRFDSRILGAIACTPILFASVMAIGLLLERL